MSKKNGKKPRYKIGKVLLGRFESERWEIRYIDPITGKYSRKRLPYTKYADAKAEAERVNISLAAKDGWAAGLERAEVRERHSVRDAVREAIKASRANERSRQDYACRYNSFSKYLASSLPNLRHWDEITTKTLLDYADHSRKQGLAPDSVRLRMCVLRLTSGYMARTYPQHNDVAAGVRLNLDRPPKTLQQRREEILTPAQVRALLEFLKERKRLESKKGNDRLVYTWICCAALTGTRLREVVYLRECDVDLVAGTITITESPAFSPKNRHSHRTIPVCDAVVEALRDWTASEDRRPHPEGYLFVPRKIKSNQGKSKYRETRAGCYSKSTFSRMMREAVKIARESGLDLPPGFVPKKLRHSFATNLRSMDADFSDLQAYMGHCPSSVLAGHYDVVSEARLARIAGLAQGLVM